MTNSCRFVWFASGKVRDHKPRQAAAPNGATWPARLSKTNDGTLVISARISGSDWHGRLVPAKPDKIEGPAILYQARSKE